MRITRREALKIAGFSIAGTALGVGCGDRDTGGGGSGSDAFPSLFTPLGVGTFTLRNRILSTAHHTAFGKGGLPSERHRDYWGSKARGGIGLVVTEVQPIHRTAGIMPTMIQCYRPEVVEAFRPVVEEVHASGAKIVSQIWHPGKSIYPAAVSELVSSSAIPSLIYGGTPRPLTLEEIQELIRLYGESAARMREAGIDGVEVHCAHGYLPQQFLSPLHNTRSDEYGGSEEARLRFALEAVESARRAVGDDFTVGARITADELAPGGLTLDDMKRLVPRLVEAGRLDYVNVSFDGAAIISPMGREHGEFVYLAEGIKQVVDVPVFCIGRITDPAMAESIVAEGRADVVGMTRANMTDPELPRKAREGRLDEIRPCIGMMVCWSRVVHPDGITCALNPSVGRERELEITPAETPRRVMVVGAGAAGLEAARVAAERGHSVVLYEEQPRLGGQLVAASKAPTRQEMAKPIAYFERQLERLGVEIHLGTPVTREVIAGESPDALIVATGGRPKRLDVPGGDAAHVVQGRDVLLGSVAAGQSVVVVSADGGMEGVSTADFLAEQGKSVRLVTPFTTALTGVETITAFYLSSRLVPSRVAMLVKTTIEAVEGDALVVTTDGREGRLTEVDTVVLCLGSEPNDDLLRAAQGLVAEIHAVGQCREVGGLLESTRDGLEAGRAV